MTRFRMLLLRPLTEALIQHSVSTGNIAGMQPLVIRLLSGHIQLNRMQCTGSKK